MGIQVGNYNIEHDEHNWILQQKKIVNPKHHNTKSDAPKERYVHVGYYGKLEHLINALLQKELKASDINTLEDIKTTLESTEKRLKNDISKLASPELARQPYVNEIKKVKEEEPIELDGIFL